MRPHPSRRACHPLPCHSRESGNPLPQILGPIRAAAPVIQPLSFPRKWESTAANHEAPSHSCHSRESGNSLPQIMRPSEPPRLSSNPCHSRESGNPLPPQLFVAVLPASDLRHGETGRCHFWLTEYTKSSESSIKYQCCVQDKKLETEEKPGFFPSRPVFQPPKKLGSLAQSFFCPVHRYQ